MVTLAISSLINALGFLPTILLSRELKFKRLTVPQIGGQLAATVVAITSVYMGARYWSLVFGSLTSCIASAVIVCRASPDAVKV